MIKFLRYFLPLVVLAIGPYGIAIVIDQVNQAGGVNTIGQFLLLTAILIFFAGVTLTAAYTVWEEAIFYDDENL